MDNLSRERYEHMLRKARQCMNSSEWDKAYEVYDLIVQKYPDNCAGYIGRIMSTTHGLDPEVAKNFYSMPHDYKKQYKLAKEYAVTDEEKEVVYAIHKYINEFNLEEEMEYQEWKDEKERRDKLLHFWLYDDLRRKAIHYVICAVLAILSVTALVTALKTGFIALWILFAALIFLNIFLIKKQRDWEHSLRRLTEVCDPYSIGEIDHDWSV